MLCQTIKLYENREDVTLSTYILDDSPEMLNGKPRGAVLVCPGGGYMFCSDREGEPIALAFAAMGYHAFVLRYSVYGEGKSNSMDANGPMPVKPHCLYPNPIRDIGKAMLYIRENAEMWRLDAAKIAICGFSAGGHNCAMYAVSWDKPLLTDFFGVEAEALRPAAVILGYAVTNHIEMKTARDPLAAKLHESFNIAYFGVAEPSDGQLKQASPALMADAQTPPAFIWATSEDGLVPARQSALMAAALAKAGVPFEAHIFESGPHGLATAAQASAGAKSELDADAAQWLPLCGAWLEKRFAFDLPALRPWQA